MPGPTASLGQHSKVSRWGGLWPSLGLFGSFLGSRLSTREEAQPTAEKARERPKGSLALAWVAGAAQEDLREARRETELFCHRKSRSPSQLIPPLAGKQPQRPLRDQVIKAFPKPQTSFSRQAPCSGQRSPWTQQGCWAAFYTDRLHTSEGGKLREAPIPSFFLGPTRTEGFVPLLDTPRSEPSLAPFKQTRNSLLLNQKAKPPPCPVSAVTGFCGCWGPLPPPRNSRPAFPLGQQRLNQAFENQ